jgi:septal ring factor EnvC (AmiA/AmiB activator)
MSSTCLMAIAIPALALASAAHASYGGGGAAPRAQKAALSDRLTGIRSQVIGLEQEILDGLHSREQARTNLKRIRALMRLQETERTLGRRRLDELQKTILELELRRSTLKEKVSSHQAGMRRSLRDLGRSLREIPAAATPGELETIDAPRRKVLAGLADRELKEIETLHADIADADQLEAKIQDEQQQLAYLMNDMKEQESVLELNRQLQVDLLRRRHAERASQLENYSKLKRAEAQVERLIVDFNARKELERAVEQERDAAKGMHGAFARLKGHLTLPVAGKVVSSFGRSFDPRSNLHVFKKGIDIDAGAVRQYQPSMPGRSRIPGSCRATAG